MITLDQVKQEIHNWTKNYLDVPSDHYNGHKPCPFAKKTLDTNDYRIELTSEYPSKWYQEFAEDDKKIYIIAYQPDVIGLGEAVEELNLKWAQDDVWGIAFEPSDEVPEDEANDPEEWGSVTDESYPLLLVQSLSELQALSLSLEKKGYYKNCSPDFMKQFNARKELRHARTNER
tara:strand:- start:363 stop:887 length:525 start_codon:yes stop_codon:yes gene_type:complete